VTDIEERRRVASRCKTRCGVDDLILLVGVYTVLAERTTLYCVPPTRRAARSESRATSDAARAVETAASRSHGTLVSDVVSELSEGDLSVPVIKRLSLLDRFLPGVIVMGWPLHRLGRAIPVSIRTSTRCRSRRERRCPSSLDSSS